ncbi:DUF3857 and transglutaminase domain-containing protein [bacterium]|nr:DUF3857 and transglutaminase domain-containing protein [bacterium]
MMFRRILFQMLLSAFCLGLYQGCSTSKWMREINWRDFNWETLPSEEDYPDAGAVILLDEARVEISHLEKYAFSTLHRHRIVKILNETGYRHANFIIPFDDNTNIIRLEARTIRPDGSIVPLDKENIFETSLYPDYVFFSDVKSKRFAMPAVEPGCVLEFRWQLQVRSFSFWTRWPFQHDDPMLVSRYTVRCPASWDFEWKCYQLDIKPKIISNEGAYTVYQWEVRNMPPLRKEIGSPHGFTQIPGLMFSPAGMTDWNDVSQWYYDLAEDRMKPDRRIKQLVDSLTHNTQTNREKLKSIYQFVRDRIRYLAIEIGIGGYQPHAASEIYANLYGDCKDMTTLIIAMAKTVGINVNPVLISTWQNGNLDTSLVSPVHFNHAIAYAKLRDNSEIWMDATDKQSPFGSLPWYDQDRLVLVVDDSANAVLKRTPADDNESNCSERQWRLKLDRDSGLSGTVLMTVTGTQARNLRILLRRQPAHELAAWCGHELLTRFPKAEVDSYNIQCLDTLELPITIDIRFHAAAMHDTNRTFVSYLPGTWSGYDWHRMFVPKERRTDVLFLFPLTIRDEVIFEHPGTWSLLSKSKSGSLFEDYAGYFYRIQSVGPDRVKYQRYFRLSDIRISHSEYAGLRSFLNDVAFLDRHAVTFRVE